MNVMALSAVKSKWYSGVFFFFFFLYNRTINVFAKFNFALFECPFLSGLTAGQLNKWQSGYVFYN